MNKATLIAIFLALLVTGLVVFVATRGDDGEGGEPGEEPGGGEPTTAKVELTDEEIDATLPVGTPTPAFEPVTASPPYVADCAGTYGGTLTWSELGEVETFHPFTPNGGATAQELRSLIFDALVSYANADWEHQPSLAHAWEHSADYLTWTFHLRKGVKWSDGEDFDAEDVLFTYEAAFHEKSQTSIKDGFRVGDAPLPTLTAPDSHTIVFKLHAVDALFLAHVGGVRIAPEHLWRDKVTADDTSFESTMTPSDDLQSIVGTGHFRVVQYAAAERVVYERNPYSWRTDRRGQRLPYVDRIIVLLHKDISTREEQFLAGGFDLLTDIQPQSYKSFSDAQRNKGGFDIARLGISLNTNWLCFNQHPGKDDGGKPYVAPHKLAWFQDVRWRQAISHAVDREGMCKILMDRRAEPIYSQTTRANRTWYTDETTRFEHDRARAAALLDELGLKPGPDGIRADAAGNKCELLLNTNVENGLRVKIIDMLKEDLQEVGITVTTRPISFNDLVRNLQDGHKWEAMVLGWGAGVPPDPLNGKNITHSSGRLHVWYPQQPEPATPWEAEVDGLIAQMDSLPDEADRVPLWHQVLQIHAEQQPMTYLFASKVYACTRTRVRNLRPSVLRPTVWWNVEELYLSESN